MIKLSGSRFTDIMPENLAEQTEIQALAYAVGRQVEKLLAYADGARTYAAIYAVPEKVLDLLAVELRTPSYDENFSIKVKRTLIAESLLFYAQMGTPAAVNRIIETIFQAGHISEWWEYGGKPYHFKAYTTNPAITSDDVEEFKRVLGTVKRLSACRQRHSYLVRCVLYLRKFFNAGCFIRAFAEKLYCRTARSIVCNSTQLEEFIQIYAVCSLTASIYIYLRRLTQLEH